MWPTGPCGSTSRSCYGPCPTSSGAGASEPGRAGPQVAQLQFHVAGLLPEDEPLGEGALGECLRDGNHLGSLRRGGPAVPVGPHPPQGKKEEGEPKPRHEHHCQRYRDHHRSTPVMSYTPPRTDTDRDSTLTTVFPTNVHPPRHAAGSRRNARGCRSPGAIPAG